MSNIKQTTSQVGHVITMACQTLTLVEMDIDNRAWLKNTPKVFAKGEVYDEMRRLAGEVTVGGNQIIEQQTKAENLGQTRRLDPKDKTWHMDFMESHRNMLLGQFQKIDRDGMPGRTAREELKERFGRILSSNRILRHGAEVDRNYRRSTSGLQRAET